MSRSAAAQLGTLTVEAIGDAVRRRIVAAIVAMAIVSLWFVDGCTSCASGSAEVNGMTLSAESILGWTAAVLFGTFALWTVALAGVLASDHLTQTLQDGSATLILARPVGRVPFALARLAGSLCVSLLTGVVLLGGCAAFIRARYGLELGPAALAGLVCAVSAVVVAALAMWLSLVLPRAATFLIVFAAVGAVSAVNFAAAFGARFGGLLAAIDGWGPPLGSLLVSALSPWTGFGAGDPAALALRLAAWALAALALLGLWFQRMELSTG
jgi:hypothetical protein